MAKVERINKEDRTALLSDGRTVPIPKHIQDELFETPLEAESKMSAQERLHGVQDLLSQVPGGKEAGSAYAAFSKSSGLGGWASTIFDIGNAAADMWRAKERPNNLSLFQEFAERYKGARRGKNQAFKEIQEQSPTASKLGTAAGIGADIFTPMGKTKIGTQAAILGTGISDKSILEDPIDFAKEAALDYGIGSLIGKVAEVPAKISNARKGIRQAASDATAFESREAQLASKYAQDKAAYDASLAAMPARQAQAQSQFSQDILSQTGKLGTDIGSNRLARDAIELDNFINSTINASSMAGTREGNQLSSFFKKIIGSRPAEMAAQDIDHIYQAIESRIGKGLSHEVPVLNQFKEYLAQRLPGAAAEASAFRTYGRRIASSIDKAVDSSFKDVKKAKGVIRLAEKQMGDPGFLERVKKSVSDDVKNAVLSGQIKDFGTKVQNGTIIDEIIPIIQNNPEMVALNNKLKQFMSTMQTSGMTPVSQQALTQLSTIMADVEKEIASRSLQNLSSHQTNVAITMRDVADKVSKRLNKTLGSAPQVAAPAAPTPYTPGTPPPAFEPTNIYERLAESFENPNFYSNLIGFNPKQGLLKSGAKGAFAYGAMKFIPGASAAIPAAYLSNIGVKSGLRALSGTGKIAGAMRASLEKGARYLSATELPDLIRSIATKFPSYHDGILESPEDRRAAVAEIENNPYISLEDKAVLQANINRGKPIE
jgi:hypothetical protein